MIPIFRGRIEKGRVILDYPEKYLVWLAKLEGKRIEVTVRERTTRRSDQQNRFYWGVVVELLADHCGYSKDEMHDALKLKFLGGNPDEKGLVKMKSTTSLSTNDFVRYTNEVIRWAATLGCYIPDPSMIEY